MSPDFGEPFEGQCERAYIPIGRQGTVATGIRREEQDRLMGQIGCLEILRFG